MTEAALAEVPTIEEALAIVTPALKAKARAYRRVYYWRPEVWAKHLAACRAYRARPDVKAHAAAYDRQRRAAKRLTLRVTR